MTSEELKLLIELKKLHLEMLKILIVVKQAASIVLEKS